MRAPFSMRPAAGEAWMWARTVLDVAKPCSAMLTLSWYLAARSFGSDGSTA